MVVAAVAVVAVVVALEVTVVVVVVAVWRGVGWARKRVSGSAMIVGGVEVESGARWRKVGWAGGLVGGWMGGFGKLMNGEKGKAG